MNYENLEEQILLAKKEVKKKKNTAQAAKKRLDDAKRRLYQLEYQRDDEYIASLNGQPDWKLIFSYNEEETTRIWDYRKEVLSEVGLERTGHYNEVTRQHIFCIFFETNSIDELYLKKSQVEFLFSHLKFDPDGYKKIVIQKVKGEENYLWELVQTKKSNEFLVTHRAYSNLRESFEFNSLEAALEKIQSISDVAFESNVVKLITQN
ncbi:hypothetical protein ACQWTT_001200 [Acinetobacter baumannii]